MNAWPLAVFCVTVAAVLYLVIAEPGVTLPAKWTRNNRPWRLVLSYGYAPLVGVGVLLAAGAATGETLKLGIVGDEYIHPYGIVILFMSQAYLCTSLDKTGIFAYIAAQVTRKAGTGGHKVFAAYFLFASALTVATSNDVVILTLTPIVIHFAAVTKTDPKPLLFLEFYAANTLSMALLIGNPTNIIIGEAVDLSFLAFSKWSLLPTLVTGIITYAGLLLRFRRHINDAPPLEENPDPSSLLVDPWGAKFGCAVLVASLVMLAVANFIGAPLWAITLAAAGVLVAGNLYVHYVRPRFRAWRQRPQAASGNGQQTDAATTAQHSEVTAASSQHGGSSRPAIELVIVAQQQAGGSPCPQCHNIRRQGSPDGSVPAGTGADSMDTPASVTHSSSRVSSGWWPFNRHRQQCQWQRHATPMAQMPISAGVDATDAAKHVQNAGQQVAAESASGSDAPRSTDEADEDTLPASEGNCRRSCSSSGDVEFHASSSLRRRPSASDADRSDGGDGNGTPPGGSGGPGVSTTELDAAAASAAAAAADGAEQPAFSLWATFTELPWHVVPFLFGMFIIVESLNRGGWIDYFGQALAGATNSLFVAVFLTGAIGSLLANVVNNQPMTILVARVLLSAKFDVTPRERQAANLALIAASNVGANFTLIGSLAAVMWIKLLQAKSIKMTFMEFLWMGLSLMLLPLGICLLVFWAETVIFG